MTPHKQLFQHNPAAGIWGDCFRTCIASLLDVLPEAVPHRHADLDWYEQRDLIDAWLAPQRLRLINFAIRWPDSTPQELCEYTAYMRPGRFMLSGRHQTGTAHVVVADATGIIHDPCPLNMGLAGPFESGSWWLTFIGAAV